MHNKLPWTPQKLSRFNVFQKTFVLRMASHMEVVEQNIWKTANGEQCAILRLTLQHGHVTSADNWDSVRHRMRNLSAIPIWFQWALTTRLAMLISHVLVKHRGMSVSPEMVHVLMPIMMFIFGANNGWRLVVIAFDSQMLTTIAVFKMLFWCTHSLLNVKIQMRNSEKLLVFFDKKLFYFLIKPFKTYYKITWLKSNTSTSWKLWREHNKHYNVQSNLLWQMETLL